MGLKGIDYWLDHLALEPHLEGGYFKELLKGATTVTLTEHCERALYTSIYFLLNTDSPSHFHRLKSDEIWYFHEGAPLTIHLLHPDGQYEAVKLGHDVANGEHLQYCVPSGVIFGSSVESDYALVSCLVAPGFDYHDFELFTQAELLNKYPEAIDVIQYLAYEEIPK